MTSTAGTSTPVQRLAATAVHAYTAVGSVLALLMVHFSYQGRVEAVLWLFLAAMVIDGTDGMLARRLRVKEVLPGFDGALLDNIVDYITYVFAPMVLLWANGYLPEGWFGGLCVTVPLLASCYQFCRTDAKTDDHFFLGFPSYWNIVAFYVVVLELAETTTAVLLLVLTVLVFVPVKYVYPSRTPALWAVNMTLATLWLVLFGLITAELPEPAPLLVGLSLVYVVYYVAVSLWLTARSARRSAAAHRAAAREHQPA
ncbi:CDP-alcohol phosphatidyltransferase family protein [Nocardioides houyundeii]|uniref:CDP-alcohol phosphatidyltransferase family protein n=1 Tax=Nocardioides houyundeii TaxID=2045452 RepID=UPI000C778F52|nr:CDP-alcohol phosphatidyltransferase family protein [Nocardioides houyundeii]